LRCARPSDLFRIVLLVLLLQIGAWAKPWVVAHRGGAALGPENSLVLFEKAAAMGVDAIELDIHQSVDGHLMVIHDISLERTHGVSERVDRLTMRELVKIGVPTLQQVIDKVEGRCVLVVEVKHPKKGRHSGIERRLVQLLKQNDLLESSLVISFDAVTMQRLHELEPDLKTGFLFRLPQASLIDIKSKLGVKYVCPHFLLATPGLIKEAHSLGLKVNTWTVNDESVMKSLTRSDCDAITTDHPDLLKASLQEPMLLK
jgi:glycerophosphoryl diester phosphodiesterase